MITKGIAYILIATFSFALMNATAKELSQFHPMQVVFFRAIGTFVFTLPYALYHRVDLIGTHRLWLFLRGFLGAISLAAFFIGVQRIPLGSAISIRYLGPIFGALFATYFLREKVNGIQWISFAVAFSGVLILKGFDVRIDLFSLGVLLVSAFFVGIVFVLIRYLANREHFMTIINYFMVISIIFSLFFYSEWRMPIGTDWLPVIGIGLFGLVGQIFMTQAFQTEETSVLAPFKYMELVWALAMGFLFFGEHYEWLPFSGILLIIGGMLLNVYGKKQQSD